MVLFVALLLLSSFASGCGSEREEAPKRGARSLPGESGAEQKEQPLDIPEDHPHESPHGGMVATSGELHIELKLMRDGHIDVFVLDGEARPTSSAKTQGRVRLLLEGEVKELPLSYDEASDHLTAMSAPFQVDTLVALVELTIRGKPYSARFSYTIPQSTPRSSRPPGG